MSGVRPPEAPESGAGWPRRGERLWRRLAEAQDAALAAEELARLDEPGGARWVHTGAVAMAGPAGSGRRRGRPSRPVGAAMAVVAMAAVAAALLFVFVPRKPASPLRVQVGSGAEGGPMPSLVTEARIDLPLRFSDGSAVTFRAGSAGRLASLTARGAEIVLERGSLEAHVVHAATTAWVVRAGPYRVRVTGTRFAVSWHAERLDLVLYEGSVIVDGAVLGAGVPLLAGRRLTVASGVVRIEPLQASSDPGGHLVVEPIASRDQNGARHRLNGQPTAGGAAIDEAAGVGRKVGSGGGPPGDAVRGATTGSASSAPSSPEDHAGEADPSARATGASAAGGDGRAARTLAVREVVPAAPGPWGHPSGDSDSVIGRSLDGAADAPPAASSDGDTATTTSRRRHGRGTSAGTKAANETWLALAEDGRYPEALAAAQRLGWTTLCRRLDPHRLLTLADVARYSGARAPARRAFEALARRFPHDRLAGDAVFSLGKLAIEAGRPAAAAGWFRRYGADWPDGPLADEAAGRLMESAIRLQDTAAARAAARAYLTRAPHGPQAPLARGVLADPFDGPP